MADDKKHTYITKSGRVSKQKFETHNFIDRTKKKKMPILHEDERNRPSDNPQGVDMEVEWEKLKQERERLE